MRHLAIGEIRPSEEKDDQNKDQEQTQVEPPQDVEINEANTQLDQEEQTQEVDHPRIRKNIQKDHPVNQIIGRINEAVST